MQQGRKDTVRMSRTTMLVLSTFNALVSINTCLGAPSAYDPRREIKPSWQDNSLTPVMPEPCSTAGCWEWLGPVSINRGNTEILQEQSNNARLSDRPQMDERETNAQTDVWKAGSGIFMPRTKSSSPVIRQMSQRPVKKDAFTSRSWGPGGLPFSVLYMNPHGARSNNNRPTTAAPEVAATRAIPESAVRRNYEGAPSATTSSTRHPNNRVAVRNGSNSQPRRQYSIIPQLFISYGWGPLGK